MLNEIQVRYLSDTKFNNCKMGNEMSIVFISILKCLFIKNGWKETTKQNNRSTNNNLTNSKLSRYSSSL